MKVRIRYIIASILMTFLFVSCYENTRDDIEANNQESILRKLLDQIGMPAITHGRELRIVNQALESRDNATATWTYAYSDFLACYRLLGASVAYPIPYATQRTSPQKVVRSGGERYIVPQADPNGLFSPSSADATFVELNNPEKVNETGLGYSEPKLSTFPYKLPDDLLCPPIKEMLSLMGNGLPPARSGRN